MTQPSKADLRKHLRMARQEHVAALPDGVRALVFHRPPAPLLARISPDAIIGLYAANAGEAPAASYAGFFHELGHKVALPHFAARDAAMEFREHSDPFAHSDLEDGPFGILQPSGSAPLLVPDVIFVPLIGFTEQLDRLGQGGGHYDRWLAEHPGRIAVGLAWDVQRIDPPSALPAEAHDMALDAIVTPTRIYGL